MEPRDHPAHYKTEKFMLPRVSSPKLVHPTLQVGLKVGTWSTNGHGFLQAFLVHLDTPW